MGNYTVVAALVIAHTKNGVIHLYKGDVVPASILPESLANLKELGFVQSAEEVPASEPEPEFPEGEPAESWKGDQLKAYAKAKSIDLGGATNKADMVAAIEASKA
jgi:hypothetical protein